MKRLQEILVVSLASLAFAGTAFAQNDIGQQTEQAAKEAKQETQQAAQEAKQETKEAGREVKQESQQAAQKAEQEAKQAKEEVKQETQQAKRQAKQAVGADSAQTEPFSAVIEFKEGQAELTKDAKDKLVEAINKAKQAGEIDMAYVATWADRPFPQQDEPEVDAAKDLAEKRNDKIKEVLQEAGVWNMDTFNMADKASILWKWFNTDEAELKSQFARRKDKQMTEMDYQIFKEQGEPSKSVVVLRLESQEKN